MLCSPKLTHTHMHVHVGKQTLTHTHTHSYCSWSPPSSQSRVLSFWGVSPHTHIHPTYSSYTATGKEYEMHCMFSVLGLPKCNVLQYTCTLYLVIHLVSCIKRYEALKSIFGCQATECCTYVRTHNSACFSLRKWNVPAHFSVCYYRLNHQINPPTR